MVQARRLRRRLALRPRGALGRGRQQRRGSLRRGHTRAPRSGERRRICFAAGWRRRAAGASAAPARGACPHAAAGASAWVRERRGEYSLVVAAEGRAHAKGTNSLTTVAVCACQLMKRRSHGPHVWRGPIIPTSTTSMRTRKLSSSRARRAAQQLSVEETRYQRDLFVSPFSGKPSCTLCSPINRRRATVSRSVQVRSYPARCLGSSCTAINFN